MGGISIKNAKHSVTMDLQDGNSVLSFKVRDRTNFNNDHYVHYKRLKYFNLPIKIKNKFKNVKDFHQYLQFNTQKIQLGDKDVIVQIDGQKVYVPFQNVNEQSKIFCDVQNQEIDHQKKNMNDPFGGKGINVIFVQKGNKNKNGFIPEGDNYDDCKQTLKEVLIKLIKKNNPLKQTELQNQDLRELIDLLHNQWNIFQRNGPATPNMTKKKTKQFDRNNEVELQIETLKQDIETLKKQKDILQAEYNCHKNNFNLSIFSQQLREAQVKTQQRTKKKVIQQFLTDISFHFNKLSSNTNQSNIKIQISSRQTLFSKIDNTVNQLNILKQENKKLNEQIRLIKRQNKLKDSPSNGSDVFTVKQSHILNEQQKMQISRKTQF